MIHCCALLVLTALMAQMAGAMTATTVPPTGHSVNVTIATGINITITVVDANLTNTNGTMSCIVGYGAVSSWGGGWSSYPSVTATLVSSSDNGTVVMVAHLSPKTESKYEFYAKCTDTVKTTVYSTTYGYNGRFEVPATPKCGDGVVDTSLGETCDVGGDNETGIYNCGSNCTCLPGTVPRSNGLGCWNSSAALPTAGRNKWRSRSIYQIVTDRFARGNDSSISGECNLTKKTYCGGTFRGIVDNLDYIVGMGFDAIWISPVVTNKANAFHGYHATNLSEINPHFGGSSGLLELITECHKRDVLVMIDWVSNHMASFTNYSQIFPFNETSHYHDCSSCPSTCNIADYTNQRQVETCRLSGLMDLNESVPYVREQLSYWANVLLQKYGADGFRIDTVKHMNLDYWTKFRHDVDAFMTGEVYTSSVATVATYQNPLDSLLWYPMYYTLQSVFASSGSATQIDEQLSASRSAFVDTTVLGNFLDNHDQDRFLHVNSDRTLLSNALAALLLGEGIPILYYGTEQYLNGATDPYDREALWETGFNNTDMYQLIAKLNTARKAGEVWNHSQVSLVSKSSVYAFARGPILVFVRNTGSSSSNLTLQFTAPSSVASGIYSSVLGNTENITIGSDLSVSIDLPSGGMPVVLSYVSALPSESSSDSPAVISSAVPSADVSSVAASSANEISYHSVAESSSPTAPSASAAVSSSPVGASSAVAAVSSSPVDASSAGAAVSSSPAGVSSAGAAETSSVGTSSVGTSSILADVASSVPVAAAASFFSKATILLVSVAALFAFL